MAKKVTNINQYKNDPLYPTVGERVLKEEENKEQTAPFNGVAPAPQPKPMIIANSNPEHDELENQNADDDPIRKSVYANNPVSAKEVDDTAIKDNLPGPRSYADLLAAIRKRQEATPEQEEKLRKRQKAMTILGALSDGIAGFANIFAANKGSLPVKHDPVTRELDARYRKILDDRQRRRDKWNDMQIHASMSDFGNKLQTEKEKRISAARQKAADMEYLRELQKMGITHGYNKEIKNREFYQDLYRDNNKHKNNVKEKGVEHGYNMTEIGHKGAIDFGNDVTKMQMKDQFDNPDLAFNYKDKNIVIPRAYEDIFKGQLLYLASNVLVKSKIKNGSGLLVDGKVSLSEKLGIKGNKLTNQQAQAIINALQFSGSKYGQDNLDKMLSNISNLYEQSNNTPDSNNSNVTAAKTIDSNKSNVKAANTPASNKSNVKVGKTIDGNGNLSRVPESEIHNNGNNSTTINSNPSKGIKLGLK